MRKLKLITQKSKSYEKLTEGEQCLVNHDFDIMMMGLTIAYDNGNEHIKISLDKVDKYTNELIMLVSTYEIINN